MDDAEVADRTIIAAIPDVSLIIPSYNALGKIGRCIASLQRITYPSEHFEVIFVDDCSSDGTYEFLQKRCAEEGNWRVVKLPVNSGSPSEPRNRGLNLARGEYVFFLDCDDEILPDTLSVHLARAHEKQADIVRGHLITEHRGTRATVNQLSDWSDQLSRIERIKLMIGRQSTTVCSLIRSDLLRSNSIKWHSDLRMGEDTLFLVSVLSVAKKIEYVDHPTCIYVKSSSFIPSSTQSYGNRELRDHIAVWRAAIAALKPLGIDYSRLRLQVGLQTALHAMIFMSRNDIARDTFDSFSEFLNENRLVVMEFNYSKRLKDILVPALASDYRLFLKACRPRLVIAGYDLKFIKGIMPRLESFYDIRLDEWSGHDTHNEAESRELLNWAELIWCEWLLGNAVWYSRNKKNYQRLIVRTHRFELTRSFGDELSMENVQAVVAVSALFFERLLERFPTIPREKARLLHNYLDVSSYSKSEKFDRRFRLAMIGILPARKGLARALSILAQLRRVDRRYTLDIFGSSPHDLPWLAKDPEEMRYYRDCEEFMHREGLSGSVHFRGHVDVRTELAVCNTGIVLSLSDSAREFPCSESFHVAVGDGFAAGGLSLIRYWEGAEYVWPSRFILSDEEGIVSRILEYRDDYKLYQSDCELGAAFVAQEYGVDRFVSSFVELFKEFA